MTEDSELQLQLDEIADDFLSRRRAGEEPTIDEYKRRHPDLADLIEKSLKTILFVDNLNDTAGLNGSQSRTVPTINDFKIVQKIGQGGMGVVYEAIQESLGRRVALKVLPPHFANNEIFVGRFKREARAAAKLHHTNIVPVFEVGQSNDTLYYAMQFIDGLPLDEVQQEVARIEKDGSASTQESVSKLISGTETTVAGSAFNRRSRYFESVARLMASAAEALQYAHERSIVHRDVKPSNLILDTQGVVWLTDFGLAKTNDSQITETGDFLGTARYMSPERFKGTGDHRVDIYGLGITLYELVTLSRPYDAVDRMLLIEQISTSEPKRPKEINRQIPIDLETIILRAMESDPRRRYQQAGELAGDLLRFANGQPIRSRRASFVERTVRWAQRNKALSVAMISMAATIIALIVSTVLVLHQRDFARQQSQRADTNAEKARVEARAARQAVQRLLSEVGSEELRNIPMMDDLRRKLLEEALGLNQQFLARSNSEQDRLEVAKTHRSIAEIYGMMGQEKEALEQFRLAKKVLGDGAKSEESKLALANLELGELAFLIRINQFQQVIDSGQRVAAQLSEASLQFPQKSDLIIDLSNAYQCLGRAYSFTGDYKSAEKCYRLAVETLQKQPDVTRRLAEFKYAEAHSRARLGDILKLNGQAQASIEQFQLAQARFVSLVKESPMERLYLDGLSHNCSNIGSYLLSVGKPFDAAEVFELGIESAKKLAGQFPHTLGYQNVLANQLSGLATALAISGDSEAALEKFIESADRFELLMVNFPNVPTVRHLGSQAIRRVGVHYKNMGRPNESIARFQRAFEILSSLVNEFPNRIAYKLDLAEMAYSIATLPTTKESNVEEGLGYSKDAVELAKQAVAQNPQDIRTRHKLAKYYRNLAEYYLLNDQEQPVPAMFEKAIKIQRELVDDVPEFIEHHRMLGVSLFKLAEFLRGQNQWSEALKYAEESAEICTANRAAEPGRWDHWMESSTVVMLKGDILSDLEKWNQAATSYAEAADLCMEGIESFQHRDFEKKAMLAYEALLKLPSLPDSRKRDTIFEQAKVLFEAQTNHDEPEQDLLDVWNRIKELY